MNDGSVVSIRVSPWAWPVLAMLATAVAGAVGSPNAALLTIAGLGLLLLGAAIGVHWMPGRSERPASTPHMSPPNPTAPAPPSPQRRTDLRGARLTGANLVNADLRHADLRGADLANADLSGANLQGAVLSPLEGESSERAE